MGKKGGAAKAPSPPPEPEEPIEEERSEEPQGEFLEGAFKFPDGSTYEGQYLKVGDGNLLLHGTGCLRYGPEVYNGTFDRGSYKIGRFTSCSGATYKGHFRDNLFHGQGEYSWPDGRFYNGMWKDGEMHGPGDYTNFTHAEGKFSGFSLRGSLDTGEPQKARDTYKAEYTAECLESASAALRALAERSAASGAPRQFICPQKQPSTNDVGGLDEPADVAEDRALVDAAVSGPFPEASCATKGSATAFAAALVTEDAAQLPMTGRVYEDEDDFPDQRLERHRLKLPQLRYIGQAVEFALPGGTPEGAEAGTLLAVVLVNVSKCYDMASARWKIAHVEAVPAPAEAADS